MRLYNCISVIDTFVVFKSYFKIIVLERHSKALTAGAETRRESWQKKQTFWRNFAKQLLAGKSSFFFLADVLNLNPNKGVRRAGARWPEWLPKF